jgi:hypothetical protein
MWAVDRLLKSSRQGIYRIRRFSARKILKNRQTCTDGILLNTMPKSGSVYIQKSLSKILGFATMDLGNSYGLIDQMNIQDTRTFSRGGFVSQNHLAPSPENLQVLRHFKLKMVLHMRDPRQALLSWVHHLQYVTGGNDTSEELLYVTPRPPFGYFKLSLSRQIDWQIDNYMPQLVHWAERWVEITDLNTIPIMITHQNALRTEEKAFFDKILAFYDIDLDYALPNLARTIKETHFRLADPMEWSRTVTPEQGIRAASMIPKSLSIRFGWDDPAHTPALVAVGGRTDIGPGRPK